MLMASFSDTDVSEENNNSIKREWAISSVLTLVLTGVFISMTFGLVYSTASKQAFIGGLNVILVPLFVWIIYKTKPSLWIFAGAGITTRLFL